jgi:DNA-binding ferritin-like protein
MGSNMEIFEARVLGENLSFWLKNHQIMIITSHMQKIIQIYTCLLKLSRKQESVTDGRTDRQTATITISPHRYRGVLYEIYKA